MRVAVQVTADARHELLKLLARRFPDEGDALRFAALFVEDLEQQFLRHAGPPPDSYSRRVGNGTVWWRYTDGIWANFTTATRGSRLLGGVRRIITVIGFEANPPELETRK